MTSEEGIITIGVETAPSVFLFLNTAEYLTWVIDMEYHPWNRVGHEVAKSGTYRWNLRTSVKPNRTVYAYRFDTPQPYHDTTYSVWAIIRYDYDTNIIIK